MPVVAAAAAAVFSAAVTFATAAGTAVLASAGLSAAAGVTIAGVSVATIAGVAAIGTTAMSLFSMTRKPKAGAGSASPIAFKADPNAFIPFVAGGPVGTGGNIVFAQTSGSKNKYLTYTTMLTHGGPIAQAPTFLANDAAVSFTQDGGSGASGTYRNRMWQKFALGAALGTALAMTATGSRDTPGNNGGHPFEWSAPSHKLSGMAHTLWTLMSDPDKYPQVPKPTWVLKGGPVYDPRKDSTYPGGAGPQRANNRATWSTDGNDNPFLQAITFCLGHYYNGVRVGGVGCPVEGIDLPAYVNGANVADANSWKIAWVWHTGMRKWDVLTSMLQAGAGTPLVRGSKISCMVETPRVSLGEITDADLRGDFSVTGSGNKRDRKNAIIPRCKSSAHKWTVQPFGKVTAAVYLAEDRGIERAQEVEYEAVSGPGAQVRQLASYDLANIREGLVAIIPVSAAFLKYRAGDCITVNSPKTLLNGQKVVILKREFDTRSRVVSLTVRSETDGKHAFALGQADQPPPSPSLSGIDPTVVQPPSPTQWLVEPGTVPGGTLNGGEVPVIVIRPGDPDSEGGNGGAHGDDPAATAILVRWRRADQPTAQWTQGEWPPNADRIELPGLQPGVTYLVEIAYRVRGIDGQWQSYGTVTNGSLIAGDVRLIAGRPVSEVLADLDAVPAAIEAAVAELDDTLSAALATLDAAVDAIAYDVDNPVTGLKARVGSVETLAANTASRVAVVEAKIDTPTTGILARTASLETATANLATGKADATRVTAVEAVINTPTTGILARTASLETATANLATGKADASRVAVVEATANAALSNSRVMSVGGYSLQGFGDPSVLPPLPTASVVNTAGIGYNFYQGGDVNRIVYLKDAVPVSPGQVIEITADFFIEAVVSQVRSGCEALDANFNSIGYVQGSSGSSIGAATRKALYSLTPAVGRFTLPAGTAYIRPAGQRSSGDGAWRLIQIAWKDATAEAALTARVTTTETAVSDLTGKTYARWTLGAAVPGAAAFISAEAETSPGATPTSSVAIGARVFTIYNPANDDWLPAMQVSGGNAIFTGGLQAGAFIRLGTGVGWPVALQSKSFSAADGASIAFGTNLGAVPAYEFQRDNLLPLATGETYALKLNSLTATGGTVSAKISTPGTPGNVTNTVDAASSTGPTRQMTKTGADATTGEYAVTVSGNARGRVPDSGIGDYQGTVNVNVYARKSGVWSLVGTMAAIIEETSSGGDGFRPFVRSFSVVDTFQMGDGIEAFGASRGTVSGICNTSSTVDDLVSVSWVTPGSSSGTRTALASGAKTTVKILPRN